MDYKEKFSPVVYFTYICVVLTLLTRLDLFFHQIDVITSFLHENIVEYVCMYIPEGIRTFEGQEMYVSYTKSSLESHNRLDDGVQRSTSFSFVSWDSRAVHQALVSISSGVLVVK